MKKTLTRLLSTYLIAATAFLGMAQSAQATMITSEQLVAQSSGAEQAKLASYLERADVVSRLEQLGVSASDANARVAAMSDEEAAAMNQKIDQAPAGGIIEVLVFIFLVLLITDILGFTKVFPFTRPIR
jgi:hypothetical protein